MKDFRRTEYCLKYGDIKKQKIDLLERINKEFPRTEDIHRIVGKKSNKFYLDFVNIYNKKCAYCGLSIDDVGHEVFEIDHFIFKKHPQFCGSKAKASHIDNLVLSCSICNRKKSDFYFLDENLNLFNPDSDIYPALYVRDEDYKILISEEYKDNHVVVDFYSQIQLGSDFRRLDYLIMEMRGKIEKYKFTNPKKVEVLSLALEELRIKRNNIIV